MESTTTTSTQREPGLRRVTPQQQLWELVTESQKSILRQILRRLKRRDQNDLCYALVAYLRWHIKRDFQCPFMQTIYLSIIDFVETNKASEPNAQKGGTEYGKED